jgi:hypothetical protein
MEWMSEAPHQAAKRCAASQQQIQSNKFHCFCLMDLVAEERSEAKLSCSRGVNLSFCGLWLGAQPSAAEKFHSINQQKLIDSTSFSLPSALFSLSFTSFD